MKKLLSIVLSITLLLSVNVFFAPSAYAASLKAPKGMTVYAISTGKITVKWKKAKGAKKYYIYRSKSKKKNFKRIAIVKNTKYTSSKLKKNTRYYFKVKAVSGKKRSKYSTTVSARTHKTYNKTTLKKAYKNKIQEYLNKYGNPEILSYSQDMYYDDYYVDGVSVVKKKDFNNDGIPELVICYSKDLDFDYGNGECHYLNSFSSSSGFLCEIFTYSKGAAKRVHKCRLKMDGTAGIDIPEYICFARHNHKDYLVYRPEGDGFVSTYHKALIDGKMKTVYKYEGKYNSSKGTFSYYKNGKKITESEFMKNCDIYENEILDVTFVSGISYSKCKTLVSQTESQIAEF